MYRPLANAMHFGSHLTSVPVGGGAAVPQVNKFELVTSDGQKMSLAERGQGRWRGGGCTVRTNASWVMATWDPFTHVQTNTRVKTLLYGNFVGGW